MGRWTDNINGEPDTPKGVSPVRGRVLGDPAVVIQKGAGCLAYIVTTNIKRDGSRIPLHLIGKNQSEQTRKEIEKTFRLVKADERTPRQEFELTPLSAQKLQYGKSQTKAAISRVLDAVVPVYKYSSLPELNAVLRQYNVLADRGGEASRTYKSGGLAYRVLDGVGVPVGVPIKASDFYSKPTLKNLQARFDQNESQKLRYKRPLRNKIDVALIRGRPQTIQDLTSALKKERVVLMPRIGEGGRLFGLTYIDQAHKVVFNGSSLGKIYSAQGMQDRLAASTQSPGQSIGIPGQKNIPAAPVQANQVNGKSHYENFPLLFDQLARALAVKGDNAGFGNDQSQKKKKKKRRQRH